MRDLYHKLITSITRNKLRIIKNEVYDAQSGWTGCNYYICDGDKRITDLSRNGFCFTDANVERAYNETIDYINLKNMDNIDAFRIWCDHYAENKEEE